jgi:hypothetical protein
VGIDLRCAQNVYLMVCICSYIFYEKTKHGYRCILCGRSRVGIQE